MLTLKRQWSMIAEVPMRYLKTMKKIVLATLTLLALCAIRFLLLLAPNRSLRFRLTSRSVEDGPASVNRVKLEKAYQPLLRSRSFHFVKLVLAVSFITNLMALAALGSVVHGRGGIPYLKAFFLHDINANVDAPGELRLKMLDSLPAPGVHPVIFLGDSLTSQYEWPEAFGHRLVILNRGIGGDTSAGVLKRISNIQDLHPQVVFLMIGANDAQSLRYEPADTVQNYRKIIAAIQQSSPNVRIYLEGILPSRTPKFNRWGDEVNQGLQQLVDGHSVLFVNLRPAFLDPDQLLDRRYTCDGLHLSASGYQLWRAQIKPVMDQLPTKLGYR